MRTQLFHRRLKEIYYNPSHSGSYGGIERLYRAAKSSGLVGITRKDVQDFLKTQLTYSIHKPARKKYSRNKTIVKGIDDQWQVDLVEMIQYAKINNGYRYILIAIDCFSRYAWAIPVKRKDAISIAQAIDELLKRKAFPRKPTKLQTDKGKEFFNKDVSEILDKYKIQHFATESETKAAIVERFNRTLKNRMWQYFTYKRTRRFVDILDKLINSYNQSYHRSIGCAPKNVRKNNEKAIWHHLYGKLFASMKRGKSSLPIGQQVRISKQKATFDKGYLPNWTRETFKITKSLNQPGQHVYQLKDELGEDIKGTFYDKEIQPIKEQDEYFDIEQILRRRLNQKTGQKEYFIKWQGWPAKFNSWISEKDLLQSHNGKQTSQ